MHILIAAQVWPHPGHDAQSANQIIYEFARMFRDLGCRVSFVGTFWRGAKASTAAEAAARNALGAIGVTVIEPIVLPANGRNPGRLETLVWPKAVSFFPEVAHRSVANALVDNLRPDAVFIPWSEMTTQLFAEVSALRVAYYGNPDPKNQRVNSMPPMVPSRGWLRDALTKIRLWHLERLHLKEMRRYDIFGNVAANDVSYYADNGIAGAFYTRMIYLHRYAGQWEAERDRLEQDGKTIVVANLGSQGATGNVLALDYLGTEVLAPLRSAFGDCPYEVHLYGGGRLPARVATKLGRPEVRNIGYVEDIDQALLSAPVFLCLNNATHYKVNQSRYLHVWSLGGCIVAHKDAALSLPEMVHGENALLGESPDEIAALVVQAATDRPLRRRIGRNGYATFNRDFLAQPVAVDILDRIRRAKGAASGHAEREAHAA